MLKVGTLVETLPTKTLDSVYGIITNAEPQDSTGDYVYDITYYNKEGTRPYVLGGLTDQEFVVTTLSPLEHYPVAVKHHGKLTDKEMEKVLEEFFADLD